MKPQQPKQSEQDRLIPPLPAVRTHTPSSPPPSLSTNSTLTSGAHRRIAIAVDLSDESAYAVKWAVHHYLRPGDFVILLHVRPTSVLYGADWGATDSTAAAGSSSKSQQKLEDEFDDFTNTKASDLSKPLVESNIPFKIHIVKDHDMKERLCLEVERLGLSAVIMGSRGFGAARKASKARLGSVSDYCVRHCICPVVIVRYPHGNDANGGGSSRDSLASVAGLANVGGEEVELHPVPEEEHEYRDADDDELKEVNQGN